MALLYPPKVGDILMCQFPECLVAPEMVKKRAVIVISPRLPGRDGLVTVVPISNSAPNPVCHHHCGIEVRLLPKYLQATGGNRWAKCDMLYTLSLERLSLIQDGRDRVTGKRRYDHRKVDLATVQAVRRSIASALGIAPALWT